MHSSSGVRLLLCAGLVLLLAGAAFPQGQKVTRENREANETERDNPHERAQWFLRGRTINGRPAPELLHKAYQQKLNNRRLREAATSQARTASPNQPSAATTSTPTANPNFISTTGGPFWTPIGPAPSGTASVGDLEQDYGPAVGRTTVVLVDQSDATGNTVYIGGASGGLWKSTNAANTNVQNCNTVSLSQAPYCAPNVTWTPLLDQQASLTVGAMAIQPGNPQWLVVGTGEANNSADSYYGLGFLVSQDGGSTWSLISTAKSSDGTSTVDLHGLGTTHLAFSMETIAAQGLTTNTVVASMAAAAGGLSVGAEFGTVGTVTPRGLYFSKDAGLTWQRATVCDSQTWNPPTCPAGSTPDTGSANSVLYNPFTHLFYANLRYHGFYSSPDGQYWTRLASQPASALSLTNCPSTPTNTKCILYRAEMTFVPGRAGANGKGEMYVWLVDSNDAEQGIFQATDGGSNWTQLSTSGIDSCGDSGGGCGTTQGTYNLTLLAVPNGSATDLYAGAVNEYRCTVDPVLNPTCGAKPFANLTHTYGSCGTATTGAFAHVHPDQHGIDFVRANPDVIYFGDDGGVYRTLHSQTGTPATQDCNGASQPWIQFDNLSGTMGSMIQFVWFSQNPSDAATLLGGTQDNGSMAKNGSSAATTLGNGSAAGYSWQSVNNGDGGYTDINSISPQEWFTSNPHVSVQQCINSGGITCTANAFGLSEIVNSSTVGGDNAPFYMAYMLDPQAATHLLVGTCRLWRIDRTANLATTWPASNFITYNLDQFAAGGTSACSASASNTISAIAAGGPCNGACNPGAHSGSSIGNGSQVLYLGTNAGRVFVTTNADAGFATWSDRTSGLPSSLKCNNSPCPISGIAVDPADPSGNTAYVTVMGFNVGHVFKTTNAGGSWTNLDGAAGGTGLPDNPADAVAIDPNQAGLIYVATDVGVFKSLGDGNWTEVGPSSGKGGLPNVATTALHVFGTGANAHLRVSTYGRGLWDIPIPNVPGFQLAVAPVAPVVNIAQTTTLNGTIMSFNGYNSVVNLQCTGVPATVTCTPSVTSVNTSAGTATFTVTLSATAAGTYHFSITAVGTDPAVITEQQAITLTAVIPQGLSLSAPAQAAASVGGVASTSFNLTSTNGFSGPVTLACTGLPTTAGPCTFSPAIPNLPAGGTANVTVTIPTGTTAASSTPYAFTITASSQNSQPASTAASLLVTVPPDFTMGTLAAISPSTVSAGLTGSTSFTVTGNSTFNGTISFACAGLPANAGPCAFTPAAITMTPNQAVTVNVSIPTTTSVTAGVYTVTVTSAGATTHSQTTLLTIGSPTNTFEVANPVQFSTSIAKAGQVLTGATVAVRSSNYSGAVTMSCAVSPAANAGTCSVTPTAVNLAPGGSATVNLSINTFGAAAGNYSVAVTGTGSAITATSTSFTYAVTDYTVAAGPATPILPAGSTSATISLVAQNGYTGTVAASCNVGTAPLTCSLSPLGPYAVSGSTPVPITATITGPGSSNTTASGSYAVTIQTSDAGFATLAHNATTTATIQDYRLAITDATGTAKTSATVTAGQSSSFVVNVLPQAGGFSGNVSFDASAVCSGLPSRTTCTLNALSSGTVTIAPGGTATLVIQTSAATTAALRPLNGRNVPFFAFWTMLPGALGIVLMRRNCRSVVSASRRSRVTMWFALALTLAVVGLMVACGGGGGGATTTPPPIPVPGTPAGTSTITVTSTSGSGSTAMTRTAQITLTVQ